MDGWVSEEGLRWRALAPFGVKIDCDLSAPHTPARTARLAALLADHGYVLARGQTLTMQQQTALMTPIGPIVLRPQENGYISTDVGAASSRAELSFHADAAYTDAPFAALSLHAVDVVDEASGTRFVSAEHGYDTLPAKLRAAGRRLGGDDLTDARGRGRPRQRGARSASHPAGRAPRGADQSAHRPALHRRQRDAHRPADRHGLGAEPRPAG